MALPEPAALLEVVSVAGLEAGGWVEDSDTEGVSVVAEMLVEIS